MNITEFLKDIERKIIETTLVAFGGSIAESARYLELKRSTLGEKINRLGISAAKIKIDKLDKEIRESNRDIPTIKISSLYTLKMTAILGALKANGWNRTKAAQELGMSERTVRYWVSHARKSGVKVPDNFLRKQK